ncbi:hypothetical protein HMPREF0239_00267 [Clostridium sp. ATCC BAA-442]|nr:hypothetical protein HMPREF0239_00267 [Clostridium sp. ATCC BAA-442]
MFCGIQFRIAKLQKVILERTFYKPMIFYLQEQEGLLGSRILYKKFLKKQSTQDT